MGHEDSDEEEFEQMQKELEGACVVCAFVFFSELLL